MVILNIYTEYQRDEVATILKVHMTAFVKATLGVVDHGVGSFLMLKTKWALTSYFCRDLT